MKGKRKFKRENYSKRDNDLFTDLTMGLAFLLLLGAIAGIYLSLK